MLVLVGCKGCEESLVEEIALTEISSEVQFASVKQLGPHRMSAQIQRKDERSGVITAENGETLLLVWQDEDYFSTQILRDGRTQSAVVVSAGVPYRQKRGKTWTEKEDAEPLRVDVYTTWNVWENALDLFNDRIQYTDPVEDVYEGRDTRRFSVSLNSPESGTKRDAKRRRKDGEPILLEGQVWIDSATAVRLKAEVIGVWRRGELEKTVQLSLVRSDIGIAQEVLPPDGPLERKGSPLDD
jgi:hypothetical protein